MVLFWFDVPGTYVPLFSRHFQFIWTCPYRVIEKAARGGWPTTASRLKNSMLAFISVSSLFQSAFIEMFEPDGINQLSQTQQATTCHCTRWEKQMLCLTNYQELWLCFIFQIPEMWVSFSFTDTLTDTTSMGWNVKSNLEMLTRAWIEN